MLGFKFWNVPKGLFQNLKCHLDNWFQKLKCNPEVGFKIRNTTENYISKSEIPTQQKVSKSEVFPKSMFQNLKHQLKVYFNIWNAPYKKV